VYLRRGGVPRRVGEDEAVAAWWAQPRQLAPSRHVGEQEGALRREQPARPERLHRDLVRVRARARGRARVRVRVRAGVRVRARVRVSASTVTSCAAVLCTSE